MNINSSNVLTYVKRILYMNIHEGIHISYKKYMYIYKYIRYTVETTRKQKQNYLKAADDDDDDDDDDEEDVFGPFEFNLL
jgi:hypothetical protein